jgi:hypothetical protein
MTTYQPEALQLIFAANPVLEVVNPLGPMGPGNQQVSVRFVQPLPFSFVATLLEHMWTLQEFFTTVYEDIIANSLQLQCMPLLNQICAICTAQFDGKAISWVGHAAMMVPLADSMLWEHGHNW